MLRVGIDTGGTFTDVAVLRGRRLGIHKLPSTPDDPAAAVLHGLAAVRGDEAVDVVHGTTVGLNAVLTGAVARTAFVTNAGFEDLIEIGRQVRDDLYDLRARHPVPPVPRRLRFAVSSRRTAGGELRARPAAGELATLRRRLRAAGVDAVAIGLLHSYAHPEDERAIAAALAPLGVPITCSAELLPAHGEYERFVAAILNAAIGPAVGGYTGRLARGVAPGRLRLMRSSGGIMGADEASRFPARAVFSGPAGGVLAARQLARALRLRTVAAFDMGGTSTDVSLVARRAQPADGRAIAGLPLALPAVDVHTIGCGGGSIATVDAGGALRVGPASAGADPGPACYGRGDQATVTDAHLVLGHLGADTLLAGAFPVDPDASARAVERIAKRLGTTLERAALGILEVADVAMMRALLVITAERAVDPSGLPLVAFGGAGGLHAASLQRRLSMPCALVPRDPGAFSAVGLALAGETHEELQPVLRAFDALPARELAAAGRELCARTRAVLRTRTHGAKARVVCEARLRFVGQGRGLWIALGPAIASAFRRTHVRRYGFVPTGDAPIEIVELRARGELGERALPAVRAPASRRKPEVVARRRALAGPARWDVYLRSDLPMGAELRGPCVIEEPTGAVVVPAGTACTTEAAALRLRSR